MNNLKLCKVVAISVLTLCSSVAMAQNPAQNSLIELIRSGQQSAALTAITAEGTDVDAAEPDGSTALLWATYQVDHELVRKLLDAGANASVTNNYGSTPLAEAVKLADVELVRMLLDAGADADAPNQDNQTALMLASTVGSLEIAEMLIEHGADVNAVETFRGQTALMWASAEDHPAIAELLIKHGADVTVRAVYDDWQRQMTSEPRAQFRPTGGLTALLYATRGGCYRCAVAIVEAGADIDRPNPDGITPLINALDNRHFNIAMYLIDQGADVHVWDMNGRTPIYTAIDMKSFRGGGFGFGGFGGGAPAAPPSEGPDVSAEEVISRLLSMGVDVNHQLSRIRPNGPGRGRFADYDMRGGTSAMQMAVMNNDHESIKALLAHGAEVNVYNAFRMTPLMYAAGMSGTGRRGGGGGGNPADTITTIDLLLDAGADINAQITDSYTFTAKLDTYVAGRDQEGRTALFAAAENGNAPVVKHLIARGADASIRDAGDNTALDIALAAGAAPAGPGPGGPGSAENSGREEIVALLTSLQADSSTSDQSTEEVASE